MNQDLKPYISFKNNSKGIMHSEIKCKTKTFGKKWENLQALGLCKDFRLKEYVLDWTPKQYLWKKWLLNWISPKWKTNKQKTVLCEGFCYQDEKLRYKLGEHFEINIWQIMSRNYEELSKLVSKKWNNLLENEPNT